MYKIQMKGITKVIISYLMYAVQKPKGFGTKLKKVILTSWATSLI